MPIFRIVMLPAGCGDCLWIEYGDQQNPSRLLIDGGISGTYKTIRQRLRGLSGDQRHFELLVVTHIDADHIEGILKLLSDPQIKVTFGDVWFNGWRHLPGSPFEDFGPVQGEKLTTLLDKVELKLPWNELFRRRAVSVTKTDPLPSRTLPGGMKLTLFSPYVHQLTDLRPVWERECKKAGLDPAHTPLGAPPLVTPPGIEVMGPPDVEELANTPFDCDDSEANGSSIAVLAEFDDKSVLLAGDAYPDILLESINQLVGPGENDRLRLDAFKVPHHGSKANLNRDILRKVDCTRYLFSTDGSRFKHPDREAVARVIKLGGSEPELVFNYRTNSNLIWENHRLMQRHGYSVSYPRADATGQTIDL